MSRVENKMAENLITDNIDIWTGAIKKRGSQGRGSNKKIVLYGIKKLRELILDLAVRGLLVPQDSNDEPASVLLDRIAAEKVKLVEEGKIKKQKPLLVIEENEKRFELPMGWAWARFGDCVSLKSGTSFSKEKELDVGEIPYCKVGDMNIKENIKVLKTSSRFINPSEKDLNYLIPADSIAFPKRGGAIATNKKRYIKEPIFVDLNIMVATPFKPLLLSFVMKWLDCFDLASLNTGTSVPQINNKDIEPLVFTCPPLDEQHRIVAKVDELMAFCDQLEQQTENSIAHHQTLVETLLDALTEALTTRDENGAAAFQDAWQRIADNFDVLFTTEQSIEKVKQTILQLAVMGKLVPQDPNDEPASILLEKIATEKEQLIKDGKIKKQKALPPIGDDEKPFELPVGWGWCHLQSIITIMDAGWSPACLPEPSPSKDVWGVLKTTSVQSMEYREVENKTLPISKEPRPQYEVKVGDILITRAGPKNRVGVACLVQSTRPKLMLSDKIIRFHLVDIGLYERYISLCLNAGATAEYLESTKSGMADSQVNISQDKLKLAPIPLAPIGEQLKIVERVDDILTLCDQLKTQLSEAQTIQLHLTDELAKAV